MKRRINRVDKNFPKERYEKAMADNLSALRMVLEINQDELARAAGTSRQTISLIESGARPMMWDTFLSLLMIFRCCKATRDMMTHMGIYTLELEDFLDLSSLREEPKNGKQGL